MARKLRLQTDEFLFVLLLGALATTVGYQFGLGNQTEHLPIVLRLLDPAFLQNDFFVESAVEFGPRFYYVHFLAFFSQWLPLPLVVILVALVVNIGLVALTFYAVIDLLKGDRLAGFIAAILVVSVSSFPLGLVTDIRFVDLQPASLAIPGCIAALWAGLRGKTILAAILSGISCVPHPLYGVETGAIALFTAFWVNVLDPAFVPNKARLASLGLRFLAAAGILGGIAFAFWALPAIGQSGESLTTREIIDILANFRAPHHYVPSRFPIQHYVAFAFFVATFVMCWWRWRNFQINKKSALPFLVPPITVIVACFAGYLLMEVWPSRIGVVAQPFRMLYLVKWLGFLFLGWQFSRWIQARGRRSTYGWIALLGSGAIHPVVAFMSVLAGRLDRRFHAALPAFFRVLIPLALLLATLFLVIMAGKPAETLLVAIAVIIALPLAMSTKRRWSAMLPIVVVAIVILTSAVNRSTQFLEWKSFNPILTLNDHRGDSADVARWARHNTAAGTIFLIPPAMGTFRLLAERAVVVDFEALPFDASAMRNWLSRIRNCYGDVATGGFEARNDMAENYRHISDETLQAISHLYSADYAVLHSQTHTELPVLYKNSEFKIVTLVPATAQSHYRNSASDG